MQCRGQLKCDGTGAETSIRLLAKQSSPFKSAGASVQSTTGSRVVRIRATNAGYTMFWGSVKLTGYPLHSPISPFTSPPVRHRVPSHFSWSLRITWSVYIFALLKQISVELFYLDIFHSETRDGFDKSCHGITKLSSVLCFRATHIAANYIQHTYDVM